jgi:2-oxoisovalerate dehydrogenase E1 component
MRSLDKETKLRLLKLILESRHADLREQNLNRQGKGHFHVSGMGHEALAAVSIQMEPDDYIVSYYRDRGLVLGRGMTTRELGLEYFAKRNTGSAGRQMPSHYSNRKLNIWSVPTPTGSQLLPACGMAWGILLDGKKDLVVATIGDAATRQGDFFEAICFAKEKKLPMLFLVEDNAYGISSPTRKTNPLALDALQPNDWRHIEGQNVQQVHDATAEAFGKIRAGHGPIFFWIEMERLSSHTSSDDQKLYRSVEDLAACEKWDPLKCWKEQLVEEGLITAEEFEKIDNDTKERIRREYSEAERAEDPSASELLAEVNEGTVVSKPPQGPLESAPSLDAEILPPGKYRIGDTVNLTLRAGLKEDSHRIIFGEDVEDPKGGVFRLTQKLSTDFPKQVFNSPLAESTILGVACGLAAYGKRPIFELQFIDFLYPGMNQLVTNISSLRWRSFGDWKCPVVIYAPYGAYLPGGSLWHSQANESVFAHYPGLSVIIPSTPDDAAGLLWTAMHGEDPVLFLIPKHMFWAQRETTKPIRAISFGQARVAREGNDVTVVAWGNTVEKCEEALAKIDNHIGVDLIDLRSIVPWDKAAIEKSVRKTGRLVIVQEDGENCSVGQMIISYVTGTSELWDHLVSPPILVSKPNVMIGYNPIYEYAALPDVERIVAAIRRSVSITTFHAQSPLVREPVAAAVPGGKGPPPAAEDSDPYRTTQPIVVPIMGEGIRNAKIVSLLKKPGDSIAHDDDLCEVETDKAVYPIQASVAGVMGEWKTKIGEVAEIGQELGTIVTGERVEVAVSGGKKFEPVAEDSGRYRNIEPALSQTITRKLSRVIPANLQIDARWDAIRRVREAAKKKNGKQAPSPSVMIAWAVVRAMEKHAAFRRMMLEDDTIVEKKDFDLGIAVALRDDLLATAVISDANKKSWREFLKDYNAAVDITRKGRVDAMNAPVVITSLGAFGVKAGAPIVVPPSVGTLFVGTAHREIVPNGKNNETAEVVTLSLTFDHRIVNGAGAAAFANEIRKEIEGFGIPSQSKGIIAKT